MGATSYAARVDVQGWPSVATAKQWEAAALVGAALVMAISTGVGVATMLSGGGRIGEAATRTAEMAGKYHRLSEADFRETLFPIAEGVGGLGGAAGFSAACGVVISGIESGRGGATVKWQRSHGTCPASRMGRGTTAMLPAWAMLGGGVIAVEVFTASMPSRLADQAGYAVSFAAPAGGVLPAVLGGGRR